MKPENQKCSLALHKCLMLLMGIMAISHVSSVKAQEEGISLAELALNTVVQTEIVYSSTHNGNQQDFTERGSGSIVSPDGYILTNYHVIADAQDQPATSVTILVQEQAYESPKPKYFATFVKGDSKLDLAVLQITSNMDGKPLTLPLQFLKIGDFVALNIELNQRLSLWGFPSVGGASITVIPGVVSGFLAEFDQQNFVNENIPGGDQWIKTSAEFTGGYSGGAALDEQGNLIAVPTESLLDRRGDTLYLMRPAMLAQELLKDIPGIEYATDAQVQTRVPELAELILIAESGDVDSMIRASEQGANLAEIGSAGNSVLMEAVKNNQKLMVEFLLSEYDKSQDGQKAVNQTTNVYFPETSEEYKGVTPLHLAIRRRQDDIAILLAKNNSDFSIIDSNGSTVLTLLIQEENSELFRNILPFVPKAELRRQTNSLLELAINLNNGDVVFDLLNASLFNPLSASPSGQTWLNLALSNDSYNVIHQLILSNPELVETSIDDSPLIYLAIKANAINTIKYLASNNLINLKQKDSDGKTVLELDETLHNSTIHQILSDYQWTLNNQLWHLAYNLDRDSDFSKLRRLVEMGAEPGWYKDYEGLNSLYNLIEKYQGLYNEKPYSDLLISTIDAFLSTNMPIDTLINFSYPWNSALHEAVLYPEILELVLPHVDASTLNSERLQGSLLVKAVNGTQEKSIELLLEAGQSPDFVGHFDDFSPLTLAIRRGSDKIANQLLDAGADPNLLDEEFLSPLGTAVCSNQIDMVQLLLNHENKADVNAIAYDRFPFELSAYDLAIGGRPAIAFELEKHDADLKLGQNIERSWPLELTDHMCKLYEQTYPDNWLDGTFPKTTCENFLSGLDRSNNIDLCPPIR
jgi:ankyrin repeat protein